MVGRGVLVDLPGSRRGEVAREELEPHGERLGRADFALFRSGWSLKWGTPAYDSGYPVLSTPAAAWLAGFPLKGVGFDAPSADAPGSCDLPVHRLLLGRGMVIVENLANLEALPDGAFTFLCLPLPLADAEGAPARAAAFIDRPGALTPPEPRA
jgi:kynurenine formamidase